eukprot:scaffold16752_cov85-Cyclotella_meneghiniana.AAC.10
MGHPSNGRSLCPCESAGKAHMDVIKYFDSSLGRFSNRAYGILVNILQAITTAGSSRGRDHYRQRHHFTTVYVSYYRCFKGRDLCPEFQPHPLS